VQARKIKNARDHPVSKGLRRRKGASREKKGPTKQTLLNNSAKNSDFHWPGQTWRI